MSKTYCELIGDLANSRRAKLDNKFDKARTHTHNPT